MAKNVVTRPRLDRLIGKAINKPIVWITAPAGSGKTTLVASYLDAHQHPCLWYQCDESDADLATFFYYMGLAAKKAAPGYKNPLPLLTPEYLAGIPTFTRKYFENLFARLGKHSDFFIVLDNYQTVPDDSMFHQMLATGLDNIPVGGHVLVISRSGLPVALTRLQANGKLSLLHENDIRFSLAESEELIHVRFPALSTARINQIHAKTRGWAAGIVLMLEQAALPLASGETSTDVECELVYDYFAGEIFDQSDKEIQIFLLQTALLPVFNAPLADHLTGSDSAGRILATLNRHHFFTEKLASTGQSYQYHPLFRAFLLNRARQTFSSSELKSLQSRAGLLLEHAGQMEEAARLYCAAQDRKSLVRMICCHGKELLLQGRSKTLGEWISCLDTLTLNSDPWLLYWHGMSTFPIDLARTLAALEQALPLFGKQQDATGVYLCWAGIVDALAFADEWTRLDTSILHFEELRDAHPLFPSTEIELIASTKLLLCLTLRKPDQPLLVHSWLERVQTLLQKNPSFDLRVESLFCMSIHYLWTGEYEKNAVLLKQSLTETRRHQIAPFARIRIKLMQGIHAWVTADYDCALQTLSEGLDISTESGVHLYDPMLWSFKTAAQLAQSNLVAAEEALSHQKKAVLGMESALNLFFLHVNCAWHLLLTGNQRRAAEYLDMVAKQVVRLGTPYYHALWHIGMAQITYALGEKNAAVGHMETTRLLAQKIKSPVMEWYALLVEAYFLFHEEKEGEGMLALRSGLALGRQHGYVHLEFYQPSVMRELFARALAADIEPAYVRGLIRKLGLSPPGTQNPGDETSYLNTWPYPLKIITLGRFEIHLDDQPLSFFGKPQKKPLELLKALIALGGRNVADERLTDLLWPEADGDQARKSLETTLSRLRKLLERDEAICYRDRQLTLNPQLCWVDSLALESLLQKSLALSDEQTLLHCEQVVALYQGAFLAADGASPWAVTRREALKNGLLRILLHTGRHFEQANDWERASDTYARGIEIDPLAEEFYRRSIDCQRRRGNHAEAVVIYQRCCRILLSELGIVPSPETTAAFAALGQNS